LKTLINKAGGFSLVELLVALSITAVLGSVITVSITQVLTIGISDKNQMNVVKQVENSLHYINRDAQMASDIVPSGGHFPLLLTWNEWSIASNDLTGPRHQVTYTIVSNLLERVEVVDANPAITTRIADNIADTSECAFSDSVLTVKLIAHVGGFKPATETRTLEVKARPELLTIP
jgi:prepilin-type N-terminal cleavage/methylation domain-containing protein